MSVAAESPYRHKRPHEQADSSPDRQFGCGGGKRFRRAVRHTQGAAERSCSGSSGDEAVHALTASARAALMGLFPDLSEQVVSDVLTSCGDDIDVAIKRLGELRLTASCRGPEQAQATPQQAHQAALAPAAQQPQPLPQRPDVRQWADALVQQLAGAKGMDEARQQAAQALTAFQAALQQQPLQQGGKRLEDLSRENHILKRAVTIQAQRLTEASAAVAEVSILRAQVQEASAKVHSLEVANYSLALHLKQATSSTAGLSSGHPDIF